MATNLIAMPNLTKNDMGVNYPLTELKNNETTIVVPGKEYKNLVDREFSISYLPFTENIEITEKESDEIYQISPESIEKLSAKGVSDPEIIELFVSIFEVLSNFEVEIPEKKILSSLLKILEGESPERLLLNLSILNGDELIEVLTSKNPSLVYKEFIN